MNHRETDAVLRVSFDNAKDLAETLRRVAAALDNGVIVPEGWDVKMGISTEAVALWRDNEPVGWIAPPETVCPDEWDIPEPNATVMI